MPSTETPIVPETGDVRPVAGKLLVAIFAAAILLPGVVQIVRELGGRVETAKAGNSAPDHRFQLASIITGLPRVDLLSSKPGGVTLLKHIQDYESELEKQSIVSNAVQPLVQWTQLKILAQANEKVMMGDKGWLFYRPGIDFIVGSGVGEIGPARPNEAKAAVDPLPVIVKFNEALKARGVSLVLAPVPVKASIYPDRVNSGYDLRQGPAVNKALQQFYQKLQDRGVAVIDLTDTIWQARMKLEAEQAQGKSPGGVMSDLFLPMDSHWSPRGMDVYARALAAELKKRYPVLTAPAGPKDADPTAEESATAMKRFEVRPVPVANRGDLFHMLKLPVYANMFPLTNVVTEQVYDQTTRKPAASDENSRIVLLGDSATNIFSIQQDLNWGEHAGLGEHLSLYLDMPIQWIAVNGGGPSKTRQKLAREGVDRKNLVIWQFLVRDLTHPIGPWEEVSLPSEPALAAIDGPLKIKARIKQITAPPQPDLNEIYPNTIIYTLFEVEQVIEGQYEPRELLVVQWAQKDMKFLPPMRYKVGDERVLTLRPLKQVEQANQSIRQAQFVDDVKRYDLIPFWAE